MNTVCLDFLSYLEKGDKPYQFYVLPFTNTLLHFRANYEARGSYLWTFIWKRVYSLGHNKISRNLYVPIQLYVDPQIEWPKESTLPNKRKISILRKSSCKNKWRRPFLLDLLPIRFFTIFMICLVSFWFIPTFTFAIVRSSNTWTIRFLAIFHA